MRMIRLLLAMTLVCFLGAGKTPGEDAKRLQIAVIPKGTSHEFWKSIHAGAVKASQELNVDVIWQGPQKEDDRNMQIQVVQNFISRGVDAIVLAPLDDVALVKPVEEAVKRGIKVAIIDSDIRTDAYSSFVATDNYKGGQISADRLGEVLEGKGKALMLRYAEGSASTMQREQGFLEALKQHPGLELVSANQYGGATTETAYKASENLLAPFRKADGSLSLDGIFACNESTTFGMLRALQDAKWAGKVTYVGFDSSAMLIKAMENRELQGLILQNPMQMGYLGVKTLAAHLKGEKVEKRIDTGATVATPENMNQPAIRQLLEPDVKKCLKE